MIKVISCIVTVIIAAYIFWFWQDRIAERMREKKYQQEIKECNRRIKEYRRLQELINYDGDDWIIKWEDYMIEYSFSEGYPV